MLSDVVVETYIVSKAVNSKKLDFIYYVWDSETISDVVVETYVVSKMINSKRLSSHHLSRKM